MEDYDKLLEEAYEKIKPVESKIERFEIPEAKGFVEGNKTIITNFGQVASYLRRNPEHLEKFLQRELAAPSKTDGDRLIFVKKIPRSKLQEKIKIYVDKFVMCKECGKPDTELEKDGNFVFIHCLACGAKHSMAKL